VIAHRSPAPAIPAREVDRVFAAMDRQSATIADSQTVESRLSVRRSAVATDRALRETGEGELRPARPALRVRASRSPRSHVAGR
jgi:hypothetical protein